MKKRAALLLTAALALFAAATAPPASGAVERPDQDLLIVSGRGEARVTPNIAVVRLGVESRSARAAEAIQDADRRMTQVLQAIRAQNIPERNIQTVIYNVSRQYRPRPQDDQRPPELEYVVTNIVSVRLTDVNRAGAVIDAATGAGANVVQGISFQAENETAAREEALRQAARDAQTKAQTLASALGVRILGVDQITESSGPVPLPQPYGAVVAEARIDASAPVMPGENVIQASVVVRYRIGR